ncbi:MAG: hypothetical protein VB064_15260 [Oscillospiraceae bacterium]|nr:hypothetical protein [Oscillospiraceae bacterium]
MVKMITKDKNQMLWEERMLLNRLAERKGLYLNMGTVRNGIGIDYLFSDKRYLKNFIIIKNSNDLDIEMLKLSGYKVLQTEEINVNQVEFLIDYIFRT